MDMIFDLKIKLKDREDCWESGGDNKCLKFEEYKNELRNLFSERKDLRIEYDSEPQFVLRDKSLLAQSFSISEKICSLIYDHVKNNVFSLDYVVNLDFNLFKTFEQRRNKDLLKNNDYFKLLKYSDDDFEFDLDQMDHHLSIKHEDLSKFDYHWYRYNKKLLEKMKILKDYIENIINCKKNKSITCFLNPFKTKKSQNYD